MAFLQGPSPKQLEMIKQEIGEGPGDMDRCVRDLQSMCAASPHLPPADCLDRNILELFVMGCRMDMERARGKLEAFWLARSRYRDLYHHRSLAEPPLADVFKFMDIVPLPRLTDEGLRVTVFRVRPGYPEASADVAAAVRAILLMADVRMRDETVIAGDVFVWDISSVRGSLVPRVAAAAAAVRQAIHLAHSAYPQRLKRIHVVGAAPFIAGTLQLMRSFMNEKVKRRFLLHPRASELLEHIPARALPAELGGEGPALAALTARWLRRSHELAEYLRQLNEHAAAVAPPAARSDIYGPVGAFRKLEID